MFKKLMVSKTMRRRVSWIIFAVLTLPFILFFHLPGRAPGRGPGGTAGTLFGQPVLWEEFQAETQVVRQQLAQQLGGDVPEELTPLVTQQAWERLMLLGEAKRERLTVTDQELATTVQTIPAFSDNGRFDHARYQRYLTAAGFTPQRFEALIRRDLLINKLLSRIRDDITVTDDDIKSAYLTAQERVRVSILSKDPGMFLQEVARGITEQDLRAAYDAHPEPVRIPEQITFDVLGLTRDELAKNLTITDDAIAGYYENHQDAFMSDDKTPKPLADARERIRGILLNEAIQHRLVTLAVEFEDAVKHQAAFDEIAANQGLSPRTVGPVAAENPLASGNTEPALLNAAAALAEGGMSDVVETDHGVYVLRLTRREPARVPPFEEVRQRFQDILTTARAREAANASAAQLRETLAKTLSESVPFEEACRRLEASPLTPAPFTRTDPIDGFGQSPQLTAGAFATPAGQLSHVIEAGSRYAILFVHEVIPVDAAAFTEAERTAYREEALAGKRQRRMMDWLTDVRSRAKLQDFSDNN